MREVRNEAVHLLGHLIRGGKTQLRYFCDKGMTSSVVRMLEMKSIDVEARQRGEEDGDTCLMTAAWNGHLAICRLLIDKGAQLEAKDSDGRTPLHYAALHGHVDIVCLLCDRGANVEARNKWKETPLHYAAKHGHISVVKELVEERNAEINAKIFNGWTTLMVARVFGKPDVAAYLVSRGGVE